MIESSVGYVESKKNDLIIEIRQKLEANNFNLKLENEINVNILHMPFEMAEHYLKKEIAKVSLEIDEKFIMVKNNQSFTHSQAELEICISLTSYLNQELTDISSSVFDQTIINQDIINYVISNSDHDKLKIYLWNIVEYSKQNEIELAASNAMTLLKHLKYNFNYKDLSNVKIPCSDLSEYTFFMSNFTNADLRGANLMNSQFIYSTLSNTRLSCEIPRTLPEITRRSLFAISPDLHWLAISISDIKIYDLSTKDIHITLGININHVQISWIDNDTIVSMEESGLIVKWYILKGRYAVYESNTTLWGNISYNKKFSILSWPDSTRHINFWNLNQGLHWQAYSFTITPIHLNWSDNGNYLAYVTTNKLWIYDYHAGSVKNYDSQDILKVIWTADERNLISSDFNGYISIWAFNRLKNKFRACMKAVRCLDVSSDRNSLVTCSDNFEVKIWWIKDLYAKDYESNIFNQCDDNLCVCAIRGQFDTINLVKWLGDGNIIVGTIDGTYRIWSVKKLDESYAHSGFVSDFEQDYFSHSTGTEEIFGNDMNVTRIGEAFLEWSSVPYSSFRIDY